MFDLFLDLPHTVQALLATLFTWGVTALGAGLVFFFRTMNKNALDAMLLKIEMDGSPSNA